MQTFEDFLKENEHLYDKHHKVYHVELPSDWIELAEEWHQREIEPIVKVYQKNLRFDILMESSEMYQAIKQVADGETTPKGGER